MFELQSVEPRRSAGHDTLDNLGAIDLGNDRRIGDIVHHDARAARMKSLNRADRYVPLRASSDYVILRGVDIDRSGHLASPWRGALLAQSSSEA